MAMSMSEEFRTVEQYQELAKAVRDFFELLDIVEVSSNDNEFHPISISCCRAAMIQPLDNVLTTMRKLSCD
jgi:hypothetical protein